tara:strand:- start:3170 stop:3802 length:633 start_codon:yes stop_codon:yes gene_type:complete
MDQPLGVYPLWDRVIGAEVEATLWQSIAERHVQDFREKWKPIFCEHLQALKARGLTSAADVGEYNLQDAHWKWAEKVADRKDSLSSTSFAVEVEGVAQGLMLAKMGPTVRAREPSQRGQYLVEVELLATAPWNRYGISPNPKIKGIGRLLLAAAVSLSVAEEFGGRIGLHALPQAESWYRDVCKMTDLGMDGSKMRYFEMTETQAREFLA